MIQEETKHNKKKQEEALINETKPNKRKENKQDDTSKNTIINKKNT